MGAPSERWLIEQLRAGRFPGRKVGRHWRMTDDDVSAALDICSNEARHNVADAAPTSGLTVTTRKRVLRSGR
jgi:hypothetical protein